MTTTDTAAARNVCNRLALAALATVFAVGISACGTSSNLLGPDSTIGTDGGQAANTAPIKPVQVARKIAIPDVIGAPEAVNRQVVQKLGAEMQGRNLALASQPTDKADYTLRGYMVAAKERKGTKVSYIWDLTDQAGNRLKRVTGEEIAPKTAGNDPWAAVTPALIEKITQKSVNSIAPAIPATSAAGNAVVAAAPVTSSPATPAVSTTTGSIPRSDSVIAIVTPVTGAPGDGNIALTRAMKKALASSGVRVDTPNPQSAYRVEGKVKLVGQPQGNRQPVQVLWSVADAKGANLGGLQQDNAIELGTLNGSWGPMADDAAAAAAQAIVQLLPRRQVNAGQANAGP